MLPHKARERVSQSLLRSILSTLPNRRYGLLETLNSIGCKQLAVRKLKRKDANPIPSYTMPSDSRNKLALFNPDY